MKRIRLIYTVHLFSVRQFGVLSKLSLQASLIGTKLSQTNNAYPSWQAMRLSVT